MIDQINQILNDPGSMQQIMQIAASLGMDQSTLPENAENIELTNGFSKILTSIKERDEKQQALVQALIPYLRPGHRVKLERALQAARLSHLANTALRSELRKPIQEDSYDV